MYKRQAVSGADKTLKIWDLRKFKELDHYFTPTPASSLDISDTGLLSIGWGPHVTVWKDVFKSKQSDPYMTHLIPGSKTEKVKFVPFEDILGVGHQNGFSSLIIPGSGEANFDALELNPYETAKPVSYTHLDVYKRQLQVLPRSVSELLGSFRNTFSSEGTSFRTLGN